MRGDNKTARINIRCTPKQKELIEEAARNMDLSVSEYMVLSALTDFEDPDTYAFIEHIYEKSQKWLKRRSYTFPEE